MNTADQHIILAIIAVAFHVFGILSAINALLTTRTSQSAIAWAISCITFPYIAVPAYWAFGKSRFYGYVAARRESNLQLEDMATEIRKFVSKQSGLPDDLVQSCQVLEHLAQMPFTRSNSIDLLVDGTAFFDAVFNRIREARNYILVQFFIVRGDELGRRMRDALAEKVKEGVKVYFMYDQIGSHKVSRSFLASLRKDGINVRAFRTTQGWSHRFQVNFRNHRKMVLVDGKWAATGGANLGKEYCGQSKRFGYWRDTMVSVCGPAVQEIQMSFAQDWFYVAHAIPGLNWAPERAKSRQALLVIPTGPADELHTCSMMFTQLIHTAEERLWITTPYFVPDNEIIRALQLASLRGVDVRILLPHNPDHLMVYWASFTYLEELEQTGVKFYRYTKGLLHEKVALVDDGVALVGSANMDNRSFYLNFEMTVIAADRKFAKQVESMLKEDFNNSREAGGRDYRERGVAFRILASLCRLLSPIL
ncbi:MAG: cardiolipin synthase [Verrucomicrobiota bacterium]